MASRERMAAAGLGRALTADAVSDVAAELGVGVRPVLRRVTDREAGAMEQVTLPSSAAMTMDLYGHLIDHNLWAAAERIGGTTGAPEPLRAENGEAPGEVLGL